MQMDTRIPLMGQQPDFVNTLARSTQAAQLANQNRDQNALRQLFQTQGPQIMAGEGNALNALAQIDPNAALGIQGARQDMTVQRERLGLAREASAREAARYAMDLEEGQRKQFKEATRALVGMLSVAQTPEQFEQAKQRAAAQYPGFDMSQYTFDDMPMVVAELEGAAAGFDLVERRNPVQKPADEYQRYVQEETAAGRKPLTRIEFEQAKKGRGLDIELADGTRISQGGAAGGAVPVGQNPTSTATPRAGATLAKELSKDDADALAEMQTAARTAADLESLAGQLEVVGPNVGYTGPGGNAYGAVDDLVGFLPGDEGARGAFRSLAMEAQLTFTEKTKGAITDREMGMFREAVPNLSQTKEANTLISRVMKAGAARVQTRSAFFENWARKNGSLEGAQEVWSEYMRANPILEKTEGSLSVRPEGNIGEYLNRKPASAYTPGAIMQMTAEDLAQIPIERMTAPQLDAIEQRFEMLQGAGQ